MGVSLSLSLSASSIAFPDQVIHASERLSGAIDNVTALGPEFTTTFTIGNNGPSTIPDARLIIYWPLNVKNSQNYFLYPTGWRVSPVLNLFNVQRE